MLFFVTFVPILIVILLLAFHSTLLSYFAVSTTLDSLDNTHVLQLVIVRPLYPHNECFTIHIHQSVKREPEQQECIRFVCSGIELF